MRAIPKIINLEPKSSSKIFYSICFTDKKIFLIYGFKFAE
jgi:hypothetical protein